MTPHTALRSLVPFAALVAWAASLAPWPVFAAASLPPPQGPVILQIFGHISHGNVNDEAHFDAAMLAVLPEQEVVTSTSVTEGPQVFEGVLMRDVLERVGAEGTTVTATGLNDYVIDIPMSDFSNFDVILAHTMNGERLSARTKGPLWIIYPRDDIEVLQDIRYDYRWVWQLQSIEVH